LVFGVIKNNIIELFRRILIQEGGAGGTSPLSAGGGGGRFELADGCR